MKRWGVLIVLTLSVSLIILDGTIVNVALPTIVGALKLDFTQTQWTSALYALVFASLLLLAGWAGDRWGRRTTLLIGLVLFVGSSVVCASANGAGPFLAARAVQGIGAALVLPSTLSSVNATFTGKDRAIAFGLWGSVIAAMAAIGPLLGGWLTHDISWRWVFWVNLPLGVLLLVATILIVPNTRAQQSPRIDLIGVMLSATGLGLIVLGLIEGEAYGWLKPTRELSLGLLIWRRTWPLALSPVALVVGVIALVGFIAWELLRLRTHHDPLLDLSLFRFRSFRWGNLTAMIIAAGEFGLLFVLPLYLQNALGYSPVKAGWVLAAMALGAVASGGSARHLSGRFGPGRVAQAGVVIEAVALTVLALVVHPDVSMWVVAGVLAVYGLGLGLCSAQLTSVVLADVPVDRSGQASAAQSTVRQVGSALGIAVLSTTLAQALSSTATASLNDLHLPGTTAPDLVRGLVDSAGSLLHALRGNQLHLPPTLAQEILTRFTTAFTDATRITMLVGAGALTLAFVMSTRLPQRRSTEAETLKEPQQ